MCAALQRCAPYFVAVVRCWTHRDTHTTPAMGPPRWGEPAAHLALERAQSNLHFASWRLDSSILRSQRREELPGRVATGELGDATDLVHARHAALCNHLAQQPGGAYVLLQDEEGLGVWRLEQEGAALHRLCGK